MRVKSIHKTFIAIQYGRVVFIHEPLPEKLFTIKFPGIGSIMLFLKEEHDIENAEIFITEDMNATSKIKNANVNIIRSISNIITSVEASIFCVIGRKDTNDHIGHSSVYTTGIPEEEILLEQISAENGGAPGDYFLYYVYDVDKAIEISTKDYTLIWENNVIQGIDFSIDNDKQFIEFEVDKTSVIRDGVDSIQMTARILNADGSLNDDYSGNDEIPVKTPLGLVYLKVNFHNGVKTRKFKPEMLGMYTYPASDDKVNGFKVKNVISIRAIYDTENDEETRALIG